MFWNLLTSSSDGSGAGCNGSSIVLLVVFAAAIVAWLFWSSRSQKKREQEINNTLDAIQPGNKVKTIGGICGVVVELCPEDNTFILETGSEASGKSYLKFDKKAVYQTDAVPASAAPVEEAKTEEAPFEEAKEEVVEAPASEEATEEVAENKED